MSNPVCPVQARDVSRRGSVLSPKNRKIGIMYARNHYFNCFSEELIFQKPESDSEIEYIPYGCHLVLGRYLDSNYIKKITFLRFFNCSVLSLEDIRRGRPYLKKFLSNSFPEEVDTLIIRKRGGKITRMTSYFAEIIKNSPRVLDKFSIQGLKINHRQFKRFLISFSHVNSVVLSFCKISVPQPISFGRVLEDSQIKTLDFFGCGMEEYSDWQNQPEQLRNLMEGLTTYQGLMKTLFTLKIKDCGIEAQNVRNILEESGCNHLFISIW
ncbi:unnamed protein product [Moneuplotes crassus]|uniref:Uncharacterized protein n=1 Tax=Euplotes crassus TaxID=5936 RepID=A0AAD1US99_EUPCR|nr:unnamed protein product [Moneuplotes crassus]